MKKSSACQLAVGPVSVHPASKNWRSQVEGVESARTRGDSVGGGGGGGGGEQSRIDLQLFMEGRQYLG